MEEKREKYPNEERNIKQKREKKNKKRRYDKTGHNYNLKRRSERE